MNSDAIEKVLEVRQLKVDYLTPARTVHAVRSINFDIYRSEILGLIGESGSGKTTTGMAILQLLQKPGCITGGEIRLNEKINLLELNERELRELRWCELALVAQGTMNSLNPTMRIKDQISDGIVAHEGRQDKHELEIRIKKLLEMVGLPERVYNQYQHELSGGMKQRVGIAMAVSLNPSLVIADEPTSALDVITQRVVAQTLLDIKKRLGISILLIGHDIGLIANLADRVAVMYDGVIVEIGLVQEVLTSPRHLYTQRLIQSMPSISRQKPLSGIDEETREVINHQLRQACSMNEVSPGHWVIVNE
ncbi:MAG: ABC transporter ATP-binding protein [Anaerolineaceae bacterium]